jgi:hypothetical protein
MTAADVRETTQCANTEPLRDKSEGQTEQRQRREIENMGRMGAGKTGGEGEGEGSKESTLGSGKRFYRYR